MKLLLILMLIVVNYNIAVVNAQEPAAHNHETPAAAPAPAAPSPVQPAAQQITISDEQLDKVLQKFAAKAPQPPQDPANDPACKDDDEEPSWESNITNYDEIEKKLIKDLKLKGPEEFKEIKEYLVKKNQWEIFGKLVTGDKARYNMLVNIFKRLQEDEENQVGKKHKKAIMVKAIEDTVRLARQKDDIDRAIAAEYKNQEMEQQKGRNKVIQNLLNTATNTFSKYMEAKAESDRRKYFEEQAELDRQRVSYAAIDEANHELSTIMNNHGLYDPIKIKRKSISALNDARIELMGHINSYTGQKNKAIDEIQRLRKLKIRNDDELKALKTRAMAQAKVTIDKAKKDLEDAAIKLKNLESDPQADHTALANAKSAVEISKRDYEEAKKLYENGSVEAEIENQVSGLKMNADEFEAQIAYQQKIIVAADAKVTVLKNGLGPIDRLIRDKQDKAEEKVAREEERDERLQDAVYQNQVNGSLYVPNGLMPTSRGRSSRVISLGR